MRISVIVPVYNAAAYLRPCIDSMLEQTFEDFELLLVDDGSTDGSSEICDEYDRRDRRIRVIHQENSGSVSARRAGILAARGEYVTFADSDDWIVKGRLSAMHEALARTQADMVACGHTVCTDGVCEPYQNPLPCGYYDREAVRRAIWPAMLSTGTFFQFGIAPSLCSKCIRREIALEASLNVPDAITWGDDAAVTYGCLLHARSLVIADDAGYMYRIHGASQTHRYDPQMASRIEALLTYIDQLAQQAGWQAEIQRVDYFMMLLDHLLANEIEYGQGSMGQKGEQLKACAAIPVIAEGLERAAARRRVYPMKLALESMLLRRGFCRALVLERMSERAARRCAKRVLQRMGLRR